MFFHQREEAVCCCAGDDLEIPSVLKALERADEVAMQPIDVDLAALHEAVVINSCQMIYFRLGLCPIDFTFGESDRPIKIHKIALAQQIIIEHRAQGRSERHGQAERNTIADQTLK